MKERRSWSLTEDVNVSNGIPKEDRLTEYLRSLEAENDDFLSGLREYARINDVPIVKPETESFLKTMVRLKEPNKILEIGTAIAYSTIAMAGECEADIVTMESYEKRIPIACENIKKAGLKNRITLLEGDAGKLLKTLKGSFDLIFLDAAKAQYIVWLPDIMRLMHEGSVLIADNVLQDKTVTESRFTIGRRERTTHERMREFLWQIKHDKRLQSSILPVGDGVSVSIMLKKAA